MSDPTPDLGSVVVSLTLRVEALERLVVGLVSMAPELRTAVRRIPDPTAPGSEFLGRRFFGAAELGTGLARQYEQAWRDLMARIEAVARENGGDG